MVNLDGEHLISWESEDDTIKRVFNVLESSPVKMKDKGLVASAGIRKKRITKSASFTVLELILLHQALEIYLLDDRMDFDAAESLFFACEKILVSEGVINEE